MKRSTIGWADYSGSFLNVVTGCTPVSSGCARCYARRIYERFGRDFSVVEMHPEHLKALLRWKPPCQNNKRPYASTLAPARAHSARPVAFLCDTGDLFHAEVSNAFVIEAFEVMASKKEIDWVVLTKRPGFMREHLFGGVLPFLGGSDYYPNIWLGVSVENQEAADVRLPILAECWAGQKVISVEPMLEPVNVAQWIGDGSPWWVICGAESGPGRRPFQVSWAEDLYGQCQEAKVPFFFKQGSGLRPGTNDDLPGIGKVKEWPNGL